MAKTTSTKKPTATKTTAGKTTSAAKMPAKATAAKKPVAAKSSAKTTVAKKTAAEKAPVKATAVKTSAPKSSTKMTAAKTDAAKASTSKSSAVKTTAAVKAPVTQVSIFEETGVQENQQPAHVASSENQSAKTSYMPGAFKFPSSSSFTPKKDLNKKLIVGIICAAAVLALILLIFFFQKRSAKSVAATRENTLSLVQKYMESGEYDRAMNLLDGLLKENAGDREANELMNELILLRGESNAKSAEELDAIRNELARSQAEAQKNQRELEGLLAQESSQETAAERAARLQREQEAATRRAAEQEAAAERQAQARAAEEQRRKEEAARKAAEEALAQKNRTLQREISAVNDEIAQGKSDLNANRYDSALNHFSRAQSKLPISDGEPQFSGGKNSEIAAALYDASQNVSSDADKRKLRAAAITYAEEAVKKTPNDAAAHYVLGMSALENGDRQKALSELTTAVANDRTNYVYHYQLGRVQYLQRDYSGAVASFQSAVRLNGSFAPAQYNMGLANLRLGRDAAALDAFKLARTTDTRYEKAYLEEARLLRKKGDVQSAVAAYNNVLRINSANGDALRELGLTYYDAENYVAAEESYRSALALLNPNATDPVTYYNLSAALYAQGRTVEALPYAKRAYDTRQAVNNTTSQANIVYNYALMLDNTGNATDAIPVYTEVLRLNPNHEKTKINLGTMYMSMNPPDVDMALTLFTQVYNQNKNSFEGNNNLGSAYLAKQDYKNAVQYFQNALKLDPNNNTVRQNLAQTYASDGQYDNAKTTYAELLRRDSKNWDAYIEQAKVCIQLGDNASARTYLTTLRSQQPNYRKSEVDNLFAMTSNASDAK